MSYLTQLIEPAMMENIDDFYEIAIQITSSKVNGTLFESQSATNLNIEN